jgi:hypothetical protein
LQVDSFTANDIDRFRAGSVGQVLHNQLVPTAGDPREHKEARVIGLAANLRFLLHEYNLGTLDGFVGLGIQYPA